VCVCVCVSRSAREAQCFESTPHLTSGRERKRECVCVYARERENVCVCAFVS